MQVDELARRIEAAEQRVDSLEVALAESEHELELVRSRRIVRMLDRVANSVNELKSKSVDRRPA
jgi:hypothetical protein